MNARGGIAKSPALLVLGVLWLSGGLQTAAAEDLTARAEADLAGTPREVSVEPRSIVLDGPRASRQLLVTGHYADGTLRDLTRLAEWQIADPAVFHVSAGGLVTGRGDGRAELRIRAGGLSSTVKVTIRNSHQPRPVSFRREFMPVLSVAGCSDIHCHGAPAGKDGFRLSLWGHDPELDLQQLTRELSGRRTNALEPEHSLILRKALGQTSHVGGRRFAADSFLAELFRSWQAEGLRDDPEPAILDSLAVTPAQRVLHAPASSQQLSVTATFEGSPATDVTRLTAFSSTDTAIATVDRTGLVEFKRQGEVAILCRFCGRLESVRLMHIAAPPADYHWPAPPENNYVDTHVFAKLRMLNLAPSELCSDEEFVRRVYLDLCGILPTAAETAAFIARTDADKRSRLIDELLQRPEFADWWTRKWTDVLRVSRDSIQLAGAQAFREWLHTRIAEDAPMDQLARDLLTATGESYSAPAANYYCVPRTPEKVTDPLYLQKDLAESTAQLFLGIRLQCAQCHNHPYERWTQNDYLSLAAFFAKIDRTRLGEAGPKGRPDRRQMAIAVNADAAELKSPVDGQPVAPGFPGEGPLEVDPQQDRRTVLASWLTREENPFFARALVNRVWFHLHGRGIVEPVDDFRDSNPSANDPLLAALAEDFIAHGWRLKPLIRGIANSRTYQLSSRPSPSNAGDDRYFSRHLPRPLPAEVMLDAICQVTEVPEQFEVTEDYIKGIPAGTVKFPLGTRAVQLPVNDISTLINTQGKYVRYELHPFLRVFGQPNRTETCECARESTFGRKQALELFVGSLLTRKVAEPDNVLTRLLASGQTDARRLDSLYLAALSRRPEPEAATAFLAHIAGSQNRREAWEDILWTLLNSQEFLYQH
ncbi:MAG: DUF1549 domain-containing protein [Planctomycetaceae bacterium]|nr:DUF1549 domain-containing protein [Planctomycetaceae bacterium]